MCRTTNKQKQANPSATRFRKKTRIPVFFPGGERLILSTQADDIPCDLDRDAAWCRVEELRRRSQPPPSSQVSLYQLTWQNNPAFWVSGPSGIPRSSRGQPSLLFLCSLYFNLRLHPLKTSFVGKVFFRGSCRGRDEEAADALKRFTTVSNSLKCLHGASAVNKTSGCLPWMTFLFLFKAGKTRAPLNASSSVTSAHILYSFGPQRDQTHPEVHRRANISMPKVLDFTHLWVFPLCDSQSHLTRPKANCTCTHFYPFMQKINLELQV